MSGTENDLAQYLKGFITKERYFLQIKLRKEQETSQLFLKYFSVA